MPQRQPTKGEIVEMVGWPDPLDCWGMDMCKNGCGKPAVARGLFCGRSCSASYNNRAAPRRTKAGGLCGFCAKDVIAGRFFCSNVCQRKHQHKVYIDSWISGFESGRSGMGVSTHVLRYLREICNGTCVRCNESIWLGAPIALQVDHRDGDHTNCRPENLWLLCPNCHAQQPTSGARNKGYGRAGRLIYSEKTNRAMRQALAQKDSPP